MTLAEIENLARELSFSRDELTLRVNILEDEIRAIKKKHRAALLRAIEAAAEKKEELRQAIEEGPELFEKPKTVIFHGIKVGYRKAKGEILWDDDAQVIRLINKHFPEQADVLIKVTETPVKPALAQLPVADLKKLGVTVIDTGDEIVIKPTDSEIDKLIDALLKDEEMQQAA